MLISDLQERQHAGDVNHKPSSRLPLLCARPAVTFQLHSVNALCQDQVLPDGEQEAHVCEQLAYGSYVTTEWPGSNQ